MTTESALRSRAVQLNALADRYETDDVDLEALADQIAHATGLDDPAGFVVHNVGRHRDVVDAVTVLRAAAAICVADADA